MIKYINNNQNKQSNKQINIININTATPQKRRQRGRESKPPGYGGTRKARLAVSQRISEVTLLRLSGYFRNILK